MPEDLKKMYSTIVEDSFPANMEISFVDKDKRQTLFYEKVTWVIDGVQKGLRYGENPGQEAALFKLVNGNLMLGETETIQPGRYLVSDIELLQSGKHPGKTDITDADNALNILRYLVDNRRSSSSNTIIRAVWPMPTRCPGPTSKPIWPTGWRLSAAVSRSIDLWTKAPQKPSAGSIRKWSLLLTSRKTSWRYFL